MPKSTPRPWSDQDDAFLRANYLTMQYTEIGAALGRSIKGVLNRRYELGLPLKDTRWTDEEIAQLHAAYGDDVSVPVDLTGLALKLGRDKANVSRKARNLGLTNGHRKKRITEAVSEARVGKWARNPHPRGMAGKPQTQRTRDVQRARLTAKWADDKATGTGWASEEHRQRLSDRLVQTRGEGKLKEGYSVSKKGKRADLDGQFFRSSWEANIARYLNWLKAQGQIFAWAYEPDTFWFEEIRRGVRSYTPDFRIIDREGDTPYYWEVKGWDHPRGKTARARLAKYYPDIKVVLIDEEGYKAIAKWKRLFPEWE